MTNFRYLEAAPAENEYRSKAWGESDTNVGGRTSTAIGTGMSNTNIIFATIGDTGVYAALACVYLVVTKDGVAYDDWFMPSKDELNQMYMNFYLQELGDFSDDIYWSSSEYNAISAWQQYFEFGNQGSGYLDSYERVRPVRAF